MPWWQFNADFRSALTCFERTARPFYCHETIARPS